MIQRIELKNFESHEHTVIGDLSPGLNLICGSSNSGKTSVIRALKLAAYNEFDPRAVRTGAKNCEVTVTTHRGTVKVIRGKENLWEVTPKGKPTQYFEKIGKSILSEASEIIGMGLVRLGDVEMPVNVMNQLEGHFMLSELAGKNATGSVRAQVIDEISGLSGIEGLIKAVSLDNHRWGREVKILEDRIDDVSSKMHDVSELKVERVLLEKVGKLLEDRDECREASSVLSGIHRDGEEGERAVEDTARDLSLLPDVDALMVLVKTATGGLEKRAKAQELLDQWAISADTVDDMNAELKGFDSTEKVKAIVDKMDKVFDQAMKMSTIVRGWSSENNSLLQVQKSLNATYEPDKVMTLAEGASKVVERSGAVQKLLGEANELSGKLGKMEKEFEEAGKELKEAYSEQDELLGSFVVCPLSLMPISEKCMEGLKVSVPEAKD